MRIESGIGVRDARVAANQQPRADQQHERQRDLGRDEDFAKSPVAESKAARADGTSPALLEHRVRIDARRAQRRTEPEDQSGHERDDERERENASVDADLAESRDVRRAELANGEDAAERDDQPDDAADAATAARFPSAAAATDRDRSAPTAARIAISFSRTAARDSSRFATLPHAISSTNPTAPSRT